MRNILFAAVASLTAVVPAQADAAPADEWTTEVRYDDIDLSTSTGRDQLIARVAAAARKKCRSTQKPSLAEMRLVRECLDVALERTMSQIEVALSVRSNAPQLAAGSTGASSSGRSERYR